MTDHDTMKRIFATTVPDANGRAVSPEHRASAGGGAFSSSLPPSAHYIQQSYKQPSKQYTPSGAFEWESDMTPRKSLAWLLMGAGVVVGVWLGAHIGFAVLVGG